MQHQRGHVRGRGEAVSDEFEITNYNPDRIQRIPEQREDLIGIGVSFDESLQMLFPEGRQVVVTDELHDKYRRGGVVKEINWETRKIVVFFIEDGTQIEFLPRQLNTEG